jgi:hypothetical protein
MARHGRVSVYRRASDGKYHYCDPRGNYSRDATFVLRYKEEKGHRVWETLPAGTDHTTARRKALERELALTGTPSLSKAQAKPKPLPGFTRIRDAADKYIDGLWAEGNLVPRTIKDKRFELNRWMGWTTKQHIEELERADLIAFRDRLRSEGLAEWTVKTNMTTIVTMLKHNPLKQITGLLKPEDWPDIEDTEPEPYDVEEVKALQSVATEDEKLLIRVRFARERLPTRGSSVNPHRNSVQLAAFLSGCGATAATSRLANCSQVGCMVLPENPSIKARKKDEDISRYAASFASTPESMRLSPCSATM